MDFKTLNEELKQVLNEGITAAHKVLSLDKVKDGLLDSIEIDPVFNITKDDKFLDGKSYESILWYNTEVRKNTLTIRFQANVKDGIVDKNGLFVSIVHDAWADEIKDYLKEAIEEVDFVDVYCPIKTEEDIKETTDEINKVLLEIQELSQRKCQEIMDKQIEKENTINAEFERFSKDKRFAKRNRAVDVEKSELIKKLQNLQNPTPEQLAKILAAIEG